MDVLRPLCRCCGIIWPVFCAVWSRIVSYCGIMSIYWHFRSTEPLTVSPMRKWVIAYVSYGVKAGMASGQIVGERGGNGVPLPFLAGERRSLSLHDRCGWTSNRKKCALNAWFKVTHIVSRGNFKSIHIFSRGNFESCFL